MKKFIYFAMALVLFCSCHKENEGDMFLSKATVKGATTIFRPESSTKAFGYNDAPFMTIDEDGKIRPIRFINSWGDTLDLRISSIRELNDTYLHFRGYFSCGDQNYPILLVNKNTENIYGITLKELDYRISDSQGIFTDKQGNIYFATNYDGRTPYKINVSNPDKMTVEQYLPNEQVDRADWFTFEVAPNSLMRYGTHLSNKIKCPGGRFYNLEDFLLQQLNTKNLFDYNIENVRIYSSFVVDETFYLQGEVNGGYNAEGVWQNNKIAVRLELWGDNELKLVYLPGLTQGNFLEKLEYNPVRKVYESKKQAEDLGWDNRVWDYDPQTDVCTPTNYIISNGYPYLIGRSKIAEWNKKANDMIYIAHALSDWSKMCEVNLKGYVDEVYKVEVSPKQTGMTFTGFRYLDGKNIIGTVTEDGNVTINEDTKSDNKITTLILLN